MPGYLPFIFIPLFIAFFLLVMHSLHKKGWNNLQEKYLFVSDDFQGEKIRISNLSIDGVSSNTVKIIVSHAGLFMKSSFPFSLFSKPVLIPWTEITDVQDKKALVGKYKRLVIGNPFVSVIEISDKDFQQISRYISNADKKSKF